jgi:hypothetical protein
MSRGMSFVIPYVVYPFDLFVSIGQSDKYVIKDLKTKLQDKYHIEIQELLGDNDARTMMFTGGQTVIRFRSNPNSSIIAHEVFHAVHFLFERITLPLSVSSGEAYAYLIQYITEQIEIGMKK